MIAALVPNGEVCATSMGSLGESLKLGPWLVLASKVFLSSRAGTTAFHDVRPIVPGHLVVAPVRQATKLCELSSFELADLFSTVRLCWHECFGR